jgi:hypothetical protein
LIEVFKRKIEYKFGNEISVAADVKLLKEDIYLKTGKTIGYNTLRRLYGFLPENKHSRNTLNLLSTYLGYTSYTNFLFKNKVDTNWFDWYGLNEILNRNRINDKDVNWLFRTKKNEFYYMLISSLINSFIDRKNTRDLNILFENKLLFDIERQDFAKIATSISKKIQVLPLSELNWIASFLNHISFRNLVLYSFVDIDTLSFYYGFLLKKSKPIIKEPDEDLFTNLILCFHGFLSNRPFFLDINILILPKNCHPILLGRYYSILMILKPKNRDEIFNNILVDSKNSDSVLELFQEFIPVLILLKDIEKVELIFDEYYSILLDYEHWDHVYIERFNLIALMLVYLKKGKMDLLPNLFIYFNNSVTFYSSNLYQKLLFSIVKYHYILRRVGLSEGTKLEKNNYLLLANKLEFSFFSESYLENYFD